MDEQLEIDVRTAAINHIQKLSDLYSDINLAQQVKDVVDDKAKYTDWSKRADIKAELKVDLIILLADNDYPPVDRDEVYKEIFEQAENFKKYNRVKE